MPLIPRAPDVLLGLPWLIFSAYWIISTLHVKKIETREPPKERLVRGSLMWASYVLLLAGGLPLGVLNERFLPRSFALFIEGAALTWCGVALAIWARYHLGRYWSTTVALREDHQLIRSGP